MALLVQRVSGTYHQKYFYPDVAGVGVSYNMFVWNRQLNQEAGVMRIVLGLGTRAVDRVEHDYPRIVALDDPLLRPQSAMDNLRQFSQHYMDVLNIEDNQLKTIPVKQVLGKDPDVPIDLFAAKDVEADQRMKQLGIEGEPLWILTFDNLLAETDFAGAMQQMLSTLEKYYAYPVDVEFTLNFPKQSSPQINLLQCRPLQTRGLGVKVQIPTLSPTRIFFETQGGFMGGNISQPIRQVIYIDPAGYIELSIQDKYEVARMIGRLNREIKDRLQQTTLLMGPGRWGTTTPSLGVPVRFSEINNISVLCEMSYPEGNLMPELSYGSHFFQDLVETEIFYLSLFFEKQGTLYQPKAIPQGLNIFKQLLPDAQKYASIIKVYDTSKVNLQLMADIISQRVVCFTSNHE